MSASSGAVTPIATEFTGSRAPSDGQRTKPPRRPGPASFQAAGVAVARRSYCFSSSALRLIADPALTVISRDQSLYPACETLTVCLPAASLQRGRGVAHESKQLAVSNGKIAKTLPLEPRQIAIGNYPNLTADERLITC